MLERATDTVGIEILKETFLVDQELNSIFFAAFFFLYKISFTRKVSVCILPNGKTYC